MRDDPRSLCGLKCRTSSPRRCFCWASSDWVRRPPLARATGWARSGVTLAVVATVIDAEGLNWPLIAVAVAIGAVIGVVWAQRVPMTAMPQLVAIFNGFGGAASALIATAEYARVYGTGAGIGALTAISMAFSVAVGAVTFSGSMIAFAKLQEIMQGRPIVYKLQQEMNLAMVLATVVLGGCSSFSPTPTVFACWWRCR